VLYHDLVACENNRESDYITYMKTKTLNGKPVSEFDNEDKIMTTEKANIIDYILNDIEELYWISLDEDSSVVSWLNSVSKKVCEQLKDAIEATTDEMEKLNADYTKSSELIYQNSVPYTDDDLSEHYGNKRFNKLVSILNAVGFEGSEIY